MKWGIRWEVIILLYNFLQTISLRFYCEGSIEMHEMQLHEMQLHRCISKAAFEAVSRLTLRPHDRSSIIDIRLARLPLENPTDDYDPRQHREPKQPIKLWMAYFTMLRTSFGPGVLGMPLAISQTGALLGSILSIGVGLLVLNSHFTLLWCLNEISRQLRIPYISYRYGFRIALLHGPRVCQCIGRRGPTIIAIFMVLSQLGICVVFIIFTADSLRDIMDWQSSTTAFYVLFFPYLLLEFLMKNLKIIGYLVIFSNMMTLIGVFIIMYQVFQPPYERMEMASIEPTQLLVSFGIFLFNGTYLGVVIALILRFGTKILSLEKALVDPMAMTKPLGVMNVGILFPAIFATVFGVLGYWSFGIMEENILRSLPFDEDSSMAAIGLYSLAVAFTYPLQCYPAIQIIIEVIKNLDDPPSDFVLKVIEHITRPCFVLISFLVSYITPFQGQFVAFVGNLCTTQLALVFPALMELSLIYPERYGKHKVHLIKNIIIIIFGLVCWCTGVILCGNLLYVRILSRNSPNNVDFY